MTTKYDLDMHEETEHMTMLRHVIAEYSKKSLLLKSSSTLIVTALLISAAETNGGFWYFIAALVPITLFWTLDSYYRKEEQLYMEQADQFQKEHGIEFSPFLNIIRERKVDENPGWIYRSLKWLSKRSERCPGLAPSLLFFYATLSAFIIWQACVAHNSHSVQPKLGEHHHEVQFNT